MVCHTIDRARYDSFDRLVNTLFVVVVVFYACDLATCNLKCGRQLANCWPIYNWIKESGSLGFSSVIMNTNRQPGRFLLFGYDYNLFDVICIATAFYY